MVDYEIIISAKTDPHLIPDVRRNWQNLQNHLLKQIC